MKILLAKISHSTVPVFDELEERRQGGREGERKGGGDRGEKGGVLRDGRGCVLGGMSEFTGGNGVVRVLRGVGEDRVGERRG